MKHIVIAALVALAATGASAEISDYWKEPFAYQKEQGFTGATSKIEIKGLVGRHIDNKHEADDILTKYLPDIEVVNNASNGYTSVYAPTGRLVYHQSDQMHDANFLEYKITGQGEDQLFYVKEIHKNDVDRINDYADEFEYDPNHEAAQPHLIANKAQRDYKYKDNSFYSDNNANWGNTVVVESQFNSEAFTNHVLEYRKDLNHRVAYNQWDVAHESTNQEAKQIVAGTVAIAFDKFPNLSGKEVKRIMENNTYPTSRSENESTFYHATLSALLKPHGDIK